MTERMSGRDYNPESVDAVLARIETKLDNALARVTMLENTVLSLDRFKWVLLGAASLGGAAASKVVTAMKDSIFKP